MRKGLLLPQLGLIFLFGLWAFPSAIAQPLATEAKASEEQRKCEWVYQRLGMKIDENQHPNGPAENWISAEGKWVHQQNSPIDSRVTIVRVARSDKTASGDFMRPELYDGGKNILFLGDAGGYYKAQGHKVADLYEKSGKRIVRTDFQFEGTVTTKSPPMELMHLDNRGPFPFSDGEFDTIIADRGVCHCEHKHISCCGIPITEADAEKFLREVTRVLNTKNPNSLAILHGKTYEGSVGNGSPGDFEVWQRAAEKIQQEGNVHLLLAYTAENDYFRSDVDGKVKHISYIVISPR